MKKIFFSIICLLSFISFSQAKINLEYDWGKLEYIGANDGIFNEFIVKDNELRIVFYDAADFQFIREDLNDNQISRIELGSYCQVHNGMIALVDNDVLCFYEEYENSTSNVYLAVYDLDINLLNKQKLDYFFYDEIFIDIKSENEKYFIWGNMIYDKEKRKMVRLEEAIKTAPSFKDLLEDDTDENYFKCLDEIFAGTHYKSLEYFLYNGEFIGEPFKFGYDNGYFTYVYYDEDEDKFGINIFNEEMKIIFDDYIEGVSLPHFIFREESFYLFENIIDANTPRGAIAFTNLRISEFSYNGELIDEINLSEINNAELQTNGGLLHEGREIFNIVSTKDGFYITTHTVKSFKEYDPTLNEDDILEGNMPTIQKYSYVFDVVTKETDNGTINVDKTSSKNGEKITFKVVPKEGYKLDKVIVTDDTGNQIIVKDYTFTMPNSNVTIEAIFKVDNPNTSVFVSVGISCLLLLASYVFIVLKNKKVKQYE